MAARLFETAKWYDAGGHQGESYSSYVPECHGGPVAMSYHGRRKQHWAVFPSYQEGENAAAPAACWHIGGFTGVCLHPLKIAPLDVRRFEWALDWLFGDDAAEEKPKRRRHYRARAAMQDSLREIAEDPDELFDMEWWELEAALYEALNGMGYRVYKTPSTKDGGFDLDVEIEGRRYLIEVKHWRSAKRVGPKVIEKLGAVVLREKAENGIVLSTSGFSENVMSARIVAARAPVVLGDSSKIISFCRLFVQSEGGIWQRDSNLKEVLFADTY